MYPRAPGAGWESVTLPVWEGTPRSQCWERLAFPSESGWGFSRRIFCVCLHDARCGRVRWGSAHVWSGAAHLRGPCRRGTGYRPAPPSGGRALTITLHPDLEHKKHFQSLSFGLFGYLFVWGASSEILTAASLSFLLCEREVMLRAAQESCWA